MQALPENLNMLRIVKRIEEERNAVKARRDMQMDRNAVIIDREKLNEYLMGKQTFSRQKMIHDAILRHQIKTEVAKQLAEQLPQSRKADWIVTIVIAIIVGVVVSVIQYFLRF